jgi:hypothetical protein
MHETFVLGISDIPIPDMLMKPSYRSSPVALDDCHASFQMDGPDPIEILGLSMS